MGTIDKLQFSATAFALDKVLNLVALRYPGFKEHLKERNISVQLKLRDNTAGRLLIFKNGWVSGKQGVLPGADMSMIMEDEATAKRVMALKRNQLDFVNAAKAGSIILQGKDEDTMWFSGLLLLVFSADVIFGRKYGVNMGDGLMRYTSGTNGGPVFVYVKDDRIVRITPMEFDQKDPEPWIIHAQGKTFSPPKRTTNAAHGMTIKSMIYSPDRILYPMKRVDFDPKGERNPQNRGTSGYVRISWDEALDIVSGEIKRVRTQHGPGAIFNSCGSHHMWGNVGYYLSAANRFFSCIGATRTLMNPDSWEPWYWGAMHHWGNSSRCGGAEPYSTVEDALQNAEMMVFWSSDPECTSGVYAAHEGTVRREWIKELGIKVVHIDPYYNHTAAFMGGKWMSPRPGTDVTMALAIAYVWITQGLYDKEYVADRSVGFDKWESYILGKEDGIPKTPEWQELESGIPAREIRALAEEWGSKRTYLSPGGIPAFGSAGRASYGTEWARAMVCLMAMQGFGKPGVNFGGLQYGTPLDTRFYFPGYAEGGFSGDLKTTAAPVNLYSRMPHTPSVNSAGQAIPRLEIPEALTQQRAKGYMTGFNSMEDQFIPMGYPSPGMSAARMYYKYGGSHFATQPESNRFVKMYQTDNLEIVVNQAIWMEGETKFADIILPACTNFERWDIGEFANSGGLLDKSYLQNNHRVISIQHKCIEPLGESKPDFEIFFEVSKRLGMASVYCEGNSDYDWCKRVFEASDLPREISWKKFLKKGYYVPKPMPENRRDPVAYRWFAEDRIKDTPELTPLPSEYKGEYGKGLQTQSGKFEFECSSLKRFDPNDPERPVICKYIPSWEGHHTTELTVKYPLQLISPHPRYSFHTMGDGKGSFVNDIENHRVLIDGYYYWIVRLNPAEAERRNLKHNELVEVYNDRGSVICALHISGRIAAGMAHSYESSAKYDPVGKPGESPDRGGTMNLLTPCRTLIKKAHGLAGNSCLVEIRKWEGGK